MDSRPITVLIQQTVEGDQVRIVIRDRGLGIEPSELSRIFEPFFRGGNAIRHQIRGTGLGLCLVKAIIEAHHGQVTVKSVVGEGSEFTVILPVLSTPAGDLQS